MNSDSLLHKLILDEINMYSYLISLDLVDLSIRILCVSQAASSSNCGISLH